MKITITLGRFQISLIPAVILLTQLIFLALRIFGVTCWSYWWVLSPIWIPIALWLASEIVIVILALIIGFVRGEG